MAAPCVASEVAVSLKAETSVTDHVAPLHHCVQVWVHTLNLDCASFDLILEALAELLDQHLKGRLMH